MLKRQNIYLRNIEMIKKINKDQKDYELEENQFADLTWEEFQERFLQKPKQNPWGYKKTFKNTLKLKSAKKDEKEFESIDWQKKQKVSNIKN